MFFSFFKSKYIANLNWGLSSRLFTMLVNVFVGVYVARYLSVEDFGMLNYVLSLVAIFAPIGGMGLFDIVSRELIDSPNSRDEIMGTAFVIRVIATILMIFVILISSLLIQSDMYVIYMLSIISFGSILNVFDIIYSYDQANMRLKYSSISLLVGTISFAALRLILISIDAPLHYFMYSVVFQQLVVTSLYIFFYNNSGTSISCWRFNHSKAIQLFRDAYPLLLTGLVAIACLRIDQIMIHHMLGVRELGLYSIAFRLSEFWYHIPSIVFVAFLPAIQSNRGTKGLYYKRWQAILFWLVVFSIFIALSTGIAGKQIISFLYGEKYIESYMVLNVYIWNLVFVSINMVSNKWLVMENYGNIVLLKSIAGFVLNVLLNYLLILKMGLVGAAFASLLTIIFLSFGFDLFLIRKKVFRDFLLLKFFVKIY